MNYLRRSNRGHNPRNFTPILVVIVSCGVLFSINTLAPSFFPNTLNFLAYPIWQGKNVFSSGISHAVELIHSKQSLIDQNKALAEEIAILRVSLISEDMLRRENIALWQMFGRNNEQQKGILAEVLVRPPQSAYDTLILDLGTLEGVRVGDRVFYPPNIVLGEIIEVTPSTSKAKLLSTAGNITSIVLERKNVSAEASGLGSGNFEIQLPREILVEKGDLAIIPGSSHLILGSVEDIEFDATDSLERVLLKSPINISEARFVFIESHLQ